VGDSVASKIESNEATTQELADERDAGDIANFALADGSVQAISQNYDADVFRLLGHRADGEIMKGF